ncbi:MAG: TldD/PmbA family protein [Candidatus Heimdallarchaeota archaeon]|nr:MAG: TldD/PmbA family protein [Candidatus Heimdallarchaeota archaeon]
MKQTEELDLNTVLEKSLVYLEKNNPEDVIVSGTEQVNYQLRFSRNNIIVSKRWANVKLFFFYVKNKKMAGTEISDISSIDSIYNALDDLLKFSSVLPPKEDYGGIAEGPFNYKSVPDLYDPKIINFSDNAVDMVEQGLNSAMESGANHSAGILEWGYSNNMLLTNHGVNTTESISRFEFLIRSFLTPIESGQGMSIGRKLDTLDTFQAGDNAGTIAVQSKGAKPGKNGVFDALLSPTVVADIIANPVRLANPFTIEIGQSWLKDKIGETISSELLTAYDDATIPNALGSRCADAEGVPSQRTLIIENGVLKNLIQNTSTAKKAGTVTTANAGIISPQNSNIMIEPGNFSFEEMISECKKPTIYVTSNWYTTMTNAAEGVFSTIPRDGMFLIEDGEIQEPLRELRISETFPNLVKNIIAVQNKVRQIKWWIEVTIPTFAPAMLVEDVNFSTGTQ